MMIDSLTGGIFTSVCGQVRSLHMAKLQEASVTIAYSSWDRRTDRSQYCLKPRSLQRGHKKTTTTTTTTTV